MAEMGQAPPRDPYKTFKVMDPYGYEIWFYQTVGEPKPPAGAKIV